jgi:uncharacterized protein (DUF111 family)
MIQTNIDDLPGEYLGHEFQQKLLDNGALDFYLEQVIMKKGRPGVILTILAASSKVKQIGEFILENTTAIGLRYFPVERMELSRQPISVPTSFGSLLSKEVTLPSGKSRVKIESEEINRIAKETGLSPIEILNKINKK